ncbi:hypothetical protein SLEP1_g44250 [Rubroshorea leprosula]|uniref:Ribosomal protein S18 n=1 Tax=Rubroshorea leprosula TaxID=152421 RepID=A0AAV5LFP3_9ROSI|nr:hypothetical protein SLEP1_g44250 [Rubroshorea leprosula]
MTLLQLQRFMKLTIGKSPLPIPNKRSRSGQKSFQRRAMKKKRIIRAQR